MIRPARPLVVVALSALALVGCSDDGSTVEKGGSGSGSGSVATPSPTTSTPTSTPTGS